MDPSEAETPNIDLSDHELVPGDVEDESNGEKAAASLSVEDEPIREETEELSLSVVEKAASLSVEDESNWEKAASLSEDESESDEIEELSWAVESDGEETEKEILSLSEAAEKIDPSPLAAFLDKQKGVPPELALYRFSLYLEESFSQVSSLQCFNMLKQSPLSTVPLFDVPKSVYETVVVWINKLNTRRYYRFVTSALDDLLIDWAAHAIGQKQSFSPVATLVALAMVLRCKPASLTVILPMLRWRPRYQGEDKLPLIVWMMAQASQGDLPAGLYSWARNLLPLVEGYSSQSIDLILQFVEMILSKPEARALLVNRVGLIPPCSFEMLVRLTFDASSARVGATERFEAIYPMLKEVALAPGTNADALKQIFTFSLKLAAGIGNNPALANEATSIAITVLTENVDCFKQWDVLFKENLEASVALLKKLVHEWKLHSLKLSSDTLTVNKTLNSFRIKSEKAITEGVANPCLYKEAHKSCKIISKRLSRGLGTAPLTAMVIAVAAAAAGGVGGALTLSILQVAYKSSLKRDLS